MNRRLNKLTTTNFRNLNNTRNNKNMKTRLFQSPNFDVNSQN